MRIVWRRGRAGINHLLGNPPPETQIARVLAYHLPYELMEIIIAHIALDLDTLKAFSLTCRTWYIAAVPHLHHTLTLTSRGELKPLSKLHKLGLMPLIKEIWVEQHENAWLVPQTFSRRDLRFFSAFMNVQTLVFERLEIPRFMPGVERYFAHFSPALRSITFMQPLCTPRQLSHFLSLFPNLDDIAIWEFPTYPPNVTIPVTELVPFYTPRLRGRLVLRGSNSVETWTHLIASGGRLRFCYMDLWSVRGCAPVLFEACADTLETLRFSAEDASVGE
jgi:hypothetical protein